MGGVTVEEKNKSQRRYQAVILAYAVNAIGGVPVSEFAKKLEARWVEGEITSLERREQLLAHHRLMAAESEAKRGSK